MSKAKKAPKKKSSKKRKEPRYFTPEEDAMILIGTSAREIAEKTGWRISSIYNRKTRLSKNPPSSEFSPPAVRMAAKAPTAVTTRNKEEDFMTIGINGQVILLERAKLDILRFDDGALTIKYLD